MFLTHALRAIYRSAVAASDALWEYVTLLLTGSPQTSTFVTDASTNNFQVTINGDTRPNNFSPYTTGYYSNLFNGTTDYLSVPLNSAFDITGDFTVECWVYFTALPSPNQDGNRVASMAGYSNGTTANQGFELGVNFTGNEFAMASWGSGNRAMCSFTPVLNTWYHFAATKQSSTSRLFINGVSQTLTANTLTINSAPAGSVLNIGRSSSSSGGALNYFHYVPGYISNFRIIKGTAVYTASFTPITAPLTAITNTSILTCANNRFIDGSTNNFTITRNGSTSISPFDPFVPSNTFRTYGSTYFDGTGDYLTVPNNAAFDFGSGNFTIEAWVNASASGRSNDTIFAKQDQIVAGPFLLQYTAGNSGTVALYVSINGSSFLGPIQFNGNIPVGSWNHIAIVRNGSTFTLYFNGVSAGTITNSSALVANSFVLAIGGISTGAAANCFFGYIADVRIVKGTAVYTANFTPPAAPLTAIANTSLLTLQTNQPISNNTFLDNSSLGSFITRNGNATQGSYSPYGGDWSNYFDGTGDSLAISNTTALDLPADFTVECWFNTINSTSNQALFGKWDATPAYGWVVNASVSGQSVSLGYGNSGSYVGGASWTAAINANTWYHLAVTRSGTTVKAFLNGVQLSGTFTISSNLTATAVTYIGRDDSPTLRLYSGYLSNVRVVKGTAVYTANFTPSTTPLTAIANTSLLTCQSNSLIDNSLNRFAITRNGDVSVQQFSPFNPASLLPVSYGAYFDGTGDYLSMSHSSAIDIGGGDFTVECWAYSTNISGLQYQNIFSKKITTGTTNVGYSFAIRMTGALTAWNGSSEAITTGITLANNTWYHLAWVISGSTLRIFVNGTQYFSGTYSIPANTHLATVGCGSYGGAFNDFFAGYISNLRIVKGTAVYTANFTPPTAPLTAITNTSLLTCQSNRFIDNSTNNFAITATGDARPVTQNPFGFTSALTTGYDVTTVGGSAYFDGTGDYLTLAANSLLTITAGPSFTMEAWIYPVTNTEGYPIIVSQDYGGGDNQCFQFRLVTSNNTLSFVYWTSSSRTSAVGVATTNSVILNQWNHVAVCWTGTNLYLFINGNVGFSGAVSTMYGATNSPTWIGILSTGNLGSYFKGYISDLRIIKGRALYTGPFVPPVAPVTAITNTTFLGNFANAGVIDYSGQGNLETVGDARVSTAVSKYSGSSLYFDGTGDYAVQPTNLNFGYGTGDFTIEFWLYLNTVSADQTIVSNLSSATSVNPHIYLNGASNTIRFFTNSADRITGSSLSANTWYHIAICRASGSTKMFINGTQTGSTYTDANNYGTTAPIGIGTYWSSGSPVTTLTLNGYIDDLRITKAARYTANFTPPTAALPTF